MAKSILQTTKECYLCRMKADKAGYGGELPSAGLHRHHVIYGKGNRKKSEHYGLWIYLCVLHHEYGPEAVHNNRQIRIMLCETAQRAFERIYPRQLFFAEFGINYLGFEEEERQQDKTGIEDGIALIDTDLEEGLPF